jgi:hypothetical protein
LRRFFRIRLSHWRVGIFWTVWWFLYWRRRRVWELAQVKLHSGRIAALVLKIPLVLQKRSYRDLDRANLVIAQEVRCTKRLEKY